jgi:hypothetical protein
VLPLDVRFYSALRLQRLHPLVVTIPKKAQIDSALSSVVVRPVIPGAVVFPPEAKLEPVSPGAQATFQVTPVAVGRLRDAHLEVLQQGRPVGAVRMRMLARTQRLTWFLAILGVLLTGLCVFARHHSEYSTTGYKAIEPGSGPPERLPEAVRQKIREAEAAAPAHIHRPPIEQSVSDFMPSIPGGATEQIASVVQGAYDWIYELGSSHLPFWVGLAMLVLTVASWFGHLRYRTRLRKTLDVAPAAGSVA